jgi:uncharacterized membrane protein YeaQ/YmgE (transglycosylase-associated protein family)
LSVPTFDLSVIGWIVIGFLAGALSGMVVRGSQTPRGCLPNILIGVLGGVLGGFLAKALLGTNEIYGWIGAFIVAFVGAVIIRWVLNVGSRR